MPTAPPSSRDSEISNFSKLSPFDGRYWGKANDFASSMSEFSFINFRVLVRIKLPLYLSKVPQVTEVPCFSKDGDVYLQFIFDVFSIDDTLEVNKVERVAYDDVKAVEYFLKQKFESQPEIVKAWEVESLAFSVKHVFT
ncbi:unnamed protein product [Microthlaspi erraticum]|uniref:Uncharacterized protein n=1 Tax=Microthlaspi erraticum TaxID=1685480 RepID=A0A6D2I4L3_9BRAS|nr:unnamed protein product [Microthlaspi erraticum]